MAPYEETLKGKYPGKLHAKKVVEYIRTKVPNANGVIYVESKKSKLFEDCDQEEPFRYDDGPGIPIVAMLLLTRLCSR